MPKRNKPELEPYEYLRFVVAAYEHDSALDHLDEPKQQDSMPKRKEPELDPPEQFKRFAQVVAREHDVDESGEEFERAFKKAVPARSKRQPSTVSSKDKRKKVVSKK